jgi:hypothetical protein
VSFDAPKGQKHLTLDFLNTLLEYVERCETIPEDGCRVDSDPPIEQHSIDPAEVCVKAQVAVLKVCQAGILTMDTAFNRGARHKHYTCCTVVSARRGILFARRPNSENVITTISSLRPCDSRSCRKAARLSPRLARRSLSAAA